MEPQEKLIQNTIKSMASQMQNVVSQMRRMVEDMRSDANKIENW